MTTEQEVKQDETAAMSGVMEAGALSPNGFDEFLQTGRTGRRNALPDILSKQQVQVGTGDLPEHMDKLTCTDDTSEGAGTSGEASASSAGNEAPSEEGGS